MHAVHSHEGSNTVTSTRACSFIPDVAQLRETNSPTVFRHAVWLVYFAHFLPQSHVLHSSRRSRAFLEDIVESVNTGGMMSMQPPA